MGWQGECDVCGGRLQPTLHEIFAHLCATDPEFRKLASEIKFGEPVVVKDLTHEAKDKKEKEKMTH